MIILLLHRCPSPKPRQMSCRWIDKNDSTVFEFYSPAFSQVKVEVNMSKHVWINQQDVWHHQLDTNISRFIVHQTPKLDSHFWNIEDYEPRGVPKKKDLYKVLYLPLSTSWGKYMLSVWNCDLVHQESGCLDKSLLESLHVDLPLRLEVLAPPRMHLFHKEGF